MNNKDAALTFRVWLNLTSQTPAIKHSHFCPWNMKESYCRYVGDGGLDVLNTEFTEAASADKMRRRAKLEGQVIEDDREATRKRPRNGLGNETFGQFNRNTLNDEL